MIKVKAARKYSTWSMFVITTGLTEAAILAQLTDGRVLSKKVSIEQAQSFDKLPMAERGPAFARLVKSK